MSTLAGHKREKWTNMPRRQRRNEKKRGGKQAERGIKEENRQICPEGRGETERKEVE